MLRLFQGGSSRAVLLHRTFVPSLPSPLQQAPSCEARHGSTLVLALKNPKGFGPPVPKSSSSPPSKPLSEEQSQEMKKKMKEQQSFDGGDDDDDEVPQIITDRMLKRIGVSISIPILLAVLFFPFFWYLKAVLKVDFPEWLPLLVSGTCFGASALGITYGIISTSWDPLRDGSLLGWKEAQANWPVFFENLQGKQGRK